MGLLTNYATSELVDHVFKAAYTPGNLYLALCTDVALDAADIDTGDITETDYSGYGTRPAISFGAASARVVTQDALCEFPEAAGASTSDIATWAIVDEATGLANVLAVGSFDSAWNVIANNTPRVPISEIAIEIGIASSAGFTHWTLNKMLDLMFNGTAWSTTKDSIYFGLTTATINDDDEETDITEVSGGSYAREAVPAASFSAASNGETANTAAIEFETPTASWGLVTSLGVFDALTNGNLIGLDNTNIVDQTIYIGDSIEFPIGNFTVDLD